MSLSFSLSLMFMSRDFELRRLALLELLIFIAGVAFVSLFFLLGVRPRSKIYVYIRKCKIENFIFISKS